MNFLFICSNIPAPTAYGADISQLMWYSIACDSYHEFFNPGLLLTRKLLNHGFLLVKLKSSLWMFYSRHYDLVNHYRIFVTYDHGYVLFVVITIFSFPHSWLITRFVTRVMSQVPLLVSSKSLTSGSPRVHPQFFVGIVLLNLKS